LKHHIKNIGILTIDGDPLQLPVNDKRGNVTWEKEPVLSPEGRVTAPGVQKTFDANLSDCLAMLVRFMPRDILSMDNIIQGSRLYGIVSKAKKDEEFILNDGSYEWAKKMLRDEKVGIPLFALSVPAILDALTGEATVPVEKDEEDAKQST